LAVGDLGWDGSPIHRRAEVKAPVAESGDAIHPDPLPPCAPALNPVEWPWRHLNDVEMRDPTCPDPDQWHLELHPALGRVRQEPSRFRSSFEGRAWRFESLAFCAKFNE
jgi:transposase